MSIKGWIRMGDKAGCGGTVVEGDQTCVSHGKAYAFQGAKMACQKSCMIVEGHMNAVLTNGRSQVLHGMKTTNGCPLVSTLNGIDGVGSAAAPAAAVVPDPVAGWKGIEAPPQEHSEQFDEYFIVMDEATGTPARNRYYRMALDSDEVIEGYTDDEGRTQLAMSDQRQPVNIEIAHPTQFQAD